MNYLFKTIYKLNIPKSDFLSSILVIVRWCIVYTIRQEVIHNSIRIVVTEITVLNRSVGLLFIPLLILGHSNRVGIWRSLIDILSVLYWGNLLQIFLLLCCLDILFGILFLLIFRIFIKFWLFLWLIFSVIVDWIVFLFFLIPNWLFIDFFAVIILFVNFTIPTIFITSTIRFLIWTSLLIIRFSRFRNRSSRYLIKFNLVLRFLFLFKFWIYVKIQVNRRYHTLTLNVVLNFILTPINHLYRFKLQTLFRLLLHLHFKHLPMLLTQLLIQPQTLHRINQQRGFLIFGF
jgi:hypothetical protein